MEILELFISNSHGCLQSSQLVRGNEMEAHMGFTIVFYLNSLEHPVSFPFEEKRLVPLLKSN